VVWSLETGARIITSQQVTFDESRFPKVMGVTEWEFSMQTRIEKCRATISAINFDTEEIDKHPFLFDAEEIQYVELQLETKLNPSKLEGAIVTAVYDNRKHQAVVKQFYRHL
jgi:hypothetical protein